MTIKCPLCTYPEGECTEECMAQEAEKEEAEGGICPDCEGSGEGAYEGARCGRCKGRGECAYGEQDY